MTYLTTQTDSVSQRAISTATNMSVGTVNKQIAKLTASGLVENGKITEKGLNALEPLDFAAYMGAAIQSMVYGFILGDGKWNVLFISVAVFCAIISLVSLLSSKKKKNA